MRRVKGQESRVESQKAKAEVILRTSPSPLHTPPSRSAITLVELLVTIVIISILAGLVLGVAALAGETAREAHTQHVVERLHNLLMEHYDTYKTRRVKLRQVVLDEINSDTSLTQSEKGKAIAEARLYAMRELVMMEVPDRWSDILLTDVPASPFTTTIKYPIYLDVSGSPANVRRTALTATYLRRYRQIAVRAGADGETITDNQGAECLYMIITLATGDGEARSMFGESSIGDTDGDGAPEFLDGWERPINFLRWAPGFDSQIQINANNFDGPNDTAWKTAAAGDHDPFDIFRVDPAAYRLVPLIFSAGRDETFGIRLVKPHVAWVGVSNANASFNASKPPVLNPYQEVLDTDDNTKWYLGTDNGEKESTDNIHNHLLGQR